MNNDSKFESDAEIVSRNLKISRYKDIILEAINDYDQWLMDDDYDSQPVIDRIIKRMRDRLDDV